MKDSTMNTYFSSDFQYGEGDHSERAAGACVFAEWLCEHKKATVDRVNRSDKVEVRIGPFVAQFDKEELRELLDKPKPSLAELENDEIFLKYCEDMRLNAPVSFDPSGDLTDL